ncbi:MAG: insulinase family protein [Candidatus Yanofskybacteria bacterium]|nr:insulinase family protein [Candidatus Yanofskybacteria bacterium]
MRNEIKVGILPNGVRFYSQYDWSGSSNLAGIGIKAGAIHAPPGYTGLPHLVEHLLARESLKYTLGEVDLAFEKFLGGPDDDINIRIDRVSTHFGFGNLLRRKDMFFCLDVMAYFLRDKIVTTEGIDVEKAAVLNEYCLRGTDVMPVLLDDLLHQTAYATNPARLRIDCEKEHLEKMQRSKITNFIKKHYVTDNIFLIVFGPKFEEVKELAKMYFGDWSQKSRPQLDYDHSDDFPTITSVKSCEVERKISQCHLALGFYTENYMGKNTEILTVLARILAFRLRHRLRDGNRNFNEGVYRVNVDVSKSFVHGLFCITFASTSEEFVKKGEDIVLEELRKLKEVPVDNRQLDAALYRTDTVYLEAFRKNPDILAEMVIEAACNGDEDLTHLHSFRERLGKITRKKLLSVANKYFTPNYIKVIIRPA